MSVATWRRILFTIGFTPALLGAACTNLQLRPYRNDDLLEHHRYALGEQYIEVEGLRVCYQEMGSGPTLLIIPGLCTSIDYWQQNIPALAEHYHVVAFDPPGFGKSDKPEASYELAWITERIRAFMDAKNIPRATLMGGSLGGQLGLLLALEHPERVERLVLMGSSGAWTPTGPLLNLGIRLGWSDGIVTDHLRRNWPHTFRSIVKHDTPVAQGLLRYQMAVRANDDLYAPEGRAASRALRSIFYTYCRERLPEVRVPVLLIWGQADVMHPLREALYFYRHLPNARLVIAPRTSHEVMLDEPRQFNKWVLGFLGSTDHAVEPAAYR